MSPGRPGPTETGSRMHEPYMLATRPRGPNTRRATGETVLGVGTYRTPGAPVFNDVDGQTTPADTDPQHSPRAGTRSWPGVEDPDRAPRLLAESLGRRHSFWAHPGRMGSPSSRREREGGSRRDDSRPVRLRSSGEPGRDAGDPEGSRGGSQDPVRRLQLAAVDEAPARAAGPARRPPRRRGARPDRREGRLPLDRWQGHAPTDPRGARHPGD